MSTKGNHWALNVRGVGATKKAILFALGERHNRDSDLCCPDQKLLAEDSEMSVRALQGHLEELERMRLIARHVRSPFGKGRITFYVLFFGRLRPVEGWENQSADSALGSGDQSADSVMTKAQLCALSYNPNLEPESSEDIESSGASADLFPDSIQSESQPAVVVESEEDPCKRLIFSAGLKLLTDQGVREPTARGYLGRLIAKAGTVNVANAITACMKAKPIDVSGWLMEAVKKRTPGTVAHAVESEADKLKTIDERFARYLQGERWRIHWGPRPEDPDADYPDALYEKYGFQRWTQEAPH